MGSKRRRSVAADYDGDGRSDLAIWRPSTGVWWVQTSSSNYKKYTTTEWGVSALGDVPVVGDYDGDKKADLAVYRPGTGEWWVLTSSSGYRQWFTNQWGE